MSTSLAEQLRKLAVPQTTLLAQDKKRPSLLFDPKEAANLDRATVYQIGVDGLEELKTRNIVFAQFEALEWLVYRYHIHEYNKEDILMLILPYHETNIFVRALQLLNLNEPNEKWGWLKQLQKPGIHLPKQTLYNHAATDLYFIEFVSNFVLAMIKEHENQANLVVVFNFYCTTFIGALEYSQEITEGQISQMLPVVLQGLHSEIPDFAAATYVICAKLLIKTQLSDKILERLVERISKINTPSLTKEATLLLVVLYQSQKQFKNVPELALKQLGDRREFLKALQELEDDYISIDLFLEALASCGIRVIVNCEDNTHYTKLVTGIIDHVKISNSFVETLFSIILDVYKPKQRYPEATIIWLKDFIKKIERQYPEAYDITIKKVMRPTDKSTSIKKKKTLSRLVENLSDMRDWYEIFEKLYHPSVDIRLEGIRTVNKKFHVFKNKESEVLQNALIDRLNDDKHKVVYETLTVFEHKFGEVVDMNHLCDNLICLLAKCQLKGTKWYKTAQVALRVLCYYFQGDNIPLFVAILPYLLPSNEHEMIVSKQIVSSKFGKTSSFLKNIKVNNDYKSLFKQILNNCDINGRITEIMQFVQGLQDIKELNETQKYLLLLIITECLPKCIDIEISNLILNVFNIYVANSKVVPVENCDIFSHIKVLRQQELPQEGLLNCLETLVLKTQVIENLARLDFNHSCDFYLRILNNLNTYDALHQSTAFTAYFQHFCNDSVEMFLNIAIFEGSDKNLKVSCLKFVNSLLRKGKINVKNVLPYVLVALGSNINKIRKVAIQSINLLVELQSNYTQFLVEILNNQEEILMDHEQTPLTVFNVISSTPYFQGILKELNQLLSEDYPTYFKSGIITILSLINSGDTYETMAKVAVVILINDNESLNESESDIVFRNINRFNVEYASTLTSESNIWSLIKLCLNSNKSTKLGPTSLAILNQIDRSIFSSLHESLQGILLDQVIEVATLTQIPEVIQACNHFFRCIDLDASLILKQLEIMRDVKSPKMANIRKRRVSVIPTVDILDLLEWKKGITVLENIQGKKKIRNTSVILEALFQVLKKCLDFDEQAVLEYSKQLILSTISHCCNKVENAPFPEKAFNMQLVVQCIRASPNPQTHHHALLLLSQTASIIPKEVLHNIIAIFTFVGSSVLRHDDAYSFQIISKIIDTIIPILIQDGSTESAVTVLRVFADALIDVPEHRRLPLFNQLLTCFDVNKSLYIFLLIVFEAHVVHSSTEKNSKPGSTYIPPKRLDILNELCLGFAPECILLTSNKIYEYLRKLPEEKDDKSVKTDTFTFDIKRYTPKQFRHYKYTIVTFVASFLASPMFIKKVAELPDETTSNLEHIFKNLILHLLNYIQDTSKICERNANTAQSQYWKVLLHHIYDTLDAVNALLSSKMFLMVIRGLIVYSLTNVRKRALDLLSNKLQHAPAFFDDCNDAELYDIIVAPLVNIIESMDQPELDLELEIIIQKALLSLKLLVKRMASSNTDKFIPILDIIGNFIKKAKRHENLTASLILCVAELCANLKAHAISALHKFMPTLIKLLKTQKRLDVPNLVLITGITAIHKILDCLPLFLSPYIEKLLYEIALISVKWPTNDDPKLASFFAKLKGIQDKIGLVVPMRVLLPAVEKSFNTLVAKDKYSAVQSLMTILSQSISQLKPTDIQGSLHELTCFFMGALELSNRTAEDYIIQAFVTLILKLSETSFRPLYYKFFDWAVRSESKSERVITFYNMSNALASNLKGLFVLFASHFLKNAATLLDECNTIKNSALYFEDDTKNISLIENILKTLHSIFLYDSHKFVTKERFDVLMQPIVDQLENTLGGINDLETRAKNILTPCIVQFAVATSDDALWKQMNYQILLKMRHNLPKIRLIALQCLGETAKKLGEDFLPLLPETIPFLSELLEDEDETVEKACQKTVQELEKVLGEPLQKYF